MVSAGGKKIPINILMPRQPSVNLEIQSQEGTRHDKHN